MNRRAILHTAVFGLAASASATRGWGATKADPLTGEIGVTTGSFSKHLTVEARAGKLRLLDLPKLMREELDMRVIDLMTATLASLEPGYLDELRAAAERA